MEENPERCRGQRVSDLETGAMFLEQFEFLEQPTTLSARPLSCLGTSFIDVSRHGSYCALRSEAVGRDFVVSGRCDRRELSALSVIW